MIFLQLFDIWQNYAKIMLEGVFFFWSKYSHEWESVVIPVGGIHACVQHLRNAPKHPAGKSSGFKLSHGTAVCSQLHARTLVQNHQSRDHCHAVMPNGSSWWEWERLGHHFRVILFLRFSSSRLRFAAPALLTRHYRRYRCVCLR